MERYQQLKAIREATGLTQKEFGCRVGVTRDAVAAIETGRVEKIQDVFFEHVCEIYRVNPNWLKTGEEPILIDESEELYQQALNIFSSLSPSFQRSALEQIKILLNLQNSED